MVVLWVLPVDEPYRLILFARASFILDAVAQQVVDILVGVVERFAFTQCTRLIQLAQGSRNQGIIDSTLLEPGGQDRLLNVAIVVSVVPVAKVLPLQLLLK